MMRSRAFEKLIIALREAEQDRRENENSHYAFKIIHNRDIPKYVFEDQHFPYEREQPVPMKDTPVKCFASGKLGYYSGVYGYDDELIWIEIVAKKECPDRTWRSFNWVELVEKE